MAKRPENLIYGVSDKPPMMRLVLLGAQNAMFDVIQGELLTIEIEHLVVPGAEGEQAFAHTPDGGLARVAQHQIYGESVVQIDPVGHLFVFRQCPGIHLC